MKVDSYILKRYDADEGKVFDWAEPRYDEVLSNPDDPESERIQEQQHLYASTLFIGETDTIENYIEVDKPVVEE